MLNENPDTEAGEQEGIVSVEPALRLIKLFGPINEETDFVIWSAILEYELMDNKEEITILLNTPGGDMYHMFSIIDAIKATSCPIKIIATGKIMSAGVPILAAGDKGRRFVTNNCSLMMHQIRWGDVNTHANMTVAGQEAKLSHANMKKLMLSETKMLKQDINKILDSSTDHYFTPRQAIKYGIADKVLRNLKTITKR